MAKTKQSLPEPLHFSQMNTSSCGPISHIHFLSFAIILWEQAFRGRAINSHSFCVDNLEDRNVMQYYEEGECLV